MGKTKLRHIFVLSIKPHIQLYVCIQDNGLVQQTATLTLTGNDDGADGTDDDPDVDHQEAGVDPADPPEVTPKTSEWWYIHTDPTFKYDDIAKKHFTLEDKEYDKVMQKIEQMRMNEYVDPLEEKKSLQTAKACDATDTHISLYR